MLISLFRYIQGYLKIRVTGYSPERFLNLCKNKKIAVWGLEASHNAYVMYMKVSGFRKLKPILKKTRTKVSIEERVGLPFFFYRYRKRKLFFGGCFICLCLIYSMTFFIWNIDIQGNQMITDDVLIEYFGKNNISHGMLKQDVNCEQIVKNLRKDFDDIIWVSASVEGTRLHIHIKENTDTFKLKEETESPCDIIADKSGIVKSIITRNGVPVVKVGDEVNIGDVLVSGTVDILNDAKEVVTQKQVVADADVVIESYVPYEDNLNQVYYRKEYTKKKRVLPFLKIGAYTWTLGWTKISYEDYETRTSQVQVKLGENFKFPIYFGTKKYMEYKRKKSEYSATEMEKLLEERFRQYCKNLKDDNIQIIENNLVIKQGKTGASASCLLVIQQEVGISRKIVDF